MIWCFSMDKFLEISCQIFFTSFRGEGGSIYYLNRLAVPTSLPKSSRCANLVNQFVSLLYSYNMHLIHKFILLFKPMIIINRMRVGFYWAFENQISFIRWFFLYKICRNLKYDINQGNTLGIEYSKEAFSQFKPLNRIYFPILSLYSIPDSSTKNKKILIIGPRYENEIFIFRALGLKREQIHAIDTFSYSPLIKVGDMHQMNYPDNFFTDILCSWTLSYSKTPRIAANEMTRVTQIGGRIVISVEKVSELEMKNGVKGVLTGQQRIQTKGQLIELFPNCEIKNCIEPKTSGMLICVLERLF